MRLYENKMWKVKDTGRENIGGIEVPCYGVRPLFVEKYTTFHYDVNVCTQVLQGLITSN